MGKQNVQAEKVYYQCRNFRCLRGLFPRFPSLKNEILETGKVKNEEKEYVNIIRKSGERKKKKTTQKQKNGESITPNNQETSNKIRGRTIIYKQIKTVI